MKFFALSLNLHWGIYTQSTCTAYMPLIFRGIIHFNPRYSHVILEIQHHFNVTFIKKPTNPHTKVKQKTTKNLQNHNWYHSYRLIEPGWHLHNRHESKPFQVPSVSRGLLAPCVPQMDSVTSRKEVWIRTNFGPWPLPLYLRNEINTHWITLKLIFWHVLQGSL